MDNQIKKFFELIGKGNKINFRYIEDEKSDGKKNIRPCYLKFYSQELIDEISKYNNADMKYGVFFMPNTGTNFTNDTVTNFNSVFVDLDIKDLLVQEYIDAGISKEDAIIEVKNSKINIDSIKEYKNKFMNKINELKFTYGIVHSALVESGNGYHVYYFLDEGANEKQFIECQDRLIKFYNADDSVKKPAQLLRVPDTWHLKDKDNPFKVKLLKLNDNVRYNIAKLINTLSPFSSKLDNSDAMEDRRGTTISITSKVLYPLHPLTNNIELIKKQDYMGLRGILGADNEDKVVLGSKNEVWDYLKKQNLFDFLGMDDKKFNCIFHRDRNPSANIYTDKNGIYFYKCHSSDCGFTGTIIHVTEKLTRLPIHESIEFLMNVYNVEIQKSEWQLKQESLIEENINRLNSFMKHPDDESKNDVYLMNNYPNLYQLMNTSGMIQIMRELHNIAREKLNSLSQVEGFENAVIYESVDYILMRIDGDNDFDKHKAKKREKAARKIAIAIFLYILEKIGVHQLPSDMRKRAIQEQTKERDMGNKSVRYSHPTSHYTLVSLDVNLLEKAEREAKLFYEKGLTITHFKRSTILRALGKEVADRIYPDRKDEKESDLNIRVSKCLEETLMELIKTKGWTYNDEIYKVINIPGLDKDKLFEERVINKMKWDKRKELGIDTNNEIWEREKEKWYKNFLHSIFKTIETGIIDEYGLTKKKLNKKLIQHFNVDDHELKGKYPNIYFYNTLN